MSLELCILGSGSSGNCAVVRTPAGVMLIDAGLGPRTVAKRLTGTGVGVSAVRAICLTHLDRDHFTPTWVSTIALRGIRLFCHSHKVNDLLRATMNLESATANRHRRLFKSMIRPFGTSRPFAPMHGLSVHAIKLAHDADGSHGFILDGFNSRVGYATDLGHVPAGLIERFENVDVLALESNYDPQMQRDSSRPWFLKHRIMGGKGHLSNEQAFEAIQRILDRCERNSRPLPQHIVLLHRSRECNCPHVVKRLFTQDARVAQRLTLADQFARSEWLRPVTVKPAVGEQLSLQWA